MGDFFQHDVIDVDTIIPFSQNARTHSDEQVAQLAGAIREFGFTAPLLIDENSNLIAGHGRLLAARKLGMTQVPAITVTGMDERKRRALVLADNKLAMNAGWDESILANELADLAADFGELIGFSDDELAALLVQETEGLTDEDAVPDVPENPVTVEGDVWVMGKHRIVCGSSTDADTVAKVLGDVKPHLMVTDPPYGVEYSAGWRNDAKRADGTTIGASAIGKVENDDNADWSEAWALFPGDVAYVWCAPGPLNVSVHDSLVGSGFIPRMQIIWAKSQLVIGRGHYHAQHESCWYAVKKGKTGHWHGDRKQTTIWQIAKPQKSETGHSTQKPIECMRKPIENNSSPGQAVYEPFSGSGTTIIAAEQTGRACYAIELNPAYVDVAINRWQDFTGEQATLESTGQTYAEVAECKLAG